MNKKSTFFSGLTLLIKPVSSLCNLKCEYCFYLDAVNQRQKINVEIMESKLVTKLIKNAFESSSKFINFIFQGGEPLLAGLPFFENFVDTVNKSNNKSLPVFYSIQTNGLLISEEFAQFFKTHNWLVGVSIDGGKLENDQARNFENGQSSFKEVLKGIELLKKENVLFNILSVVTSKNFSHISTTYSLYKKINFQYLQFIPCLDFVNLDNPFTLLPSDWLHFQKTLFDLWYEDLTKGIYVSIRHFDNYVNLINHHSADGCAFNGVCGEYFVVENNGDIYPCDFYCFDSNKLGTVQRNGFFQLTKSKKYLAFLNDSLTIQEKCFSCSYYSLCKGGCKKERGKDLQNYRYCLVNKEFFDYSISRFQLIAEKAKRNLSFK